MADITKTQKVMTLVGEFKDGDTRTQTIVNPKDNVTATEINAIGDFVKQNNIFIGDKAGADFLRYKTAKVRNITRTYYDLTVGA